RPAPARGRAKPSGHLIAVLAVAIVAQASSQFQPLIDDLVVCADERAHVRQSDVFDLDLVRVDGSPRAPVDQLRRGEALFVDEGFHPDNGVEILGRAPACLCGGVDPAVLVTSLDIKELAAYFGGNAR